MSAYRNRENPEKEDGQDGPLGEQEQLRKDTSYSPGSESETSAKQDDADDEPKWPGGEPIPDEVKVKPGTGGPDDEGDVEVDEGAR